MTKNFLIHEGCVHSFSFLSNEHKGFLPRTSGITRQERVKITQGSPSELSPFGRDNKNIHIPFLWKLHHKPHFYTSFSVLTALTLMITPVYECDAVQFSTKFKNISEKLAGFLSEMKIQMPGDGNFRHITVFQSRKMLGYFIKF